jgi:hypothetical protein
LLQKQVGSAENILFGFGRGDKDAHNFSNQ